MKKKYYISIAFIAMLITSCSQKVSVDNLNYINGYWEIKEVNAPDQEPRAYNVNLVVDYFQLDNGIGFRQKMVPQLDGSYQTNAIQEQIRVVDSIGKFFIKYKTAYAKWEEQILSIEENSFSVKNENDIIYEYVRYQPLKIE